MEEWIRKGRKEGVDVRKGRSCEKGKEGKGKDREEGLGWVRTGWVREREEAAGRGRNGKGRKGWMREGEDR